MSHSRKKNHKQGFKPRRSLYARKGARRRSYL